MICFHPGRKGRLLFRLVWFLVLTSAICLGILWSSHAAGAGSPAVPRVHFLDVGKGAATWVEVGDGRHVLIDTGNVITGARVLAILGEAGVRRLEALIITHPHPDHMGGIFHLLRTIKADRILDNGQSIEAKPACDIYRWYVEAVRSRPDYSILKKGDHLEWGAVQMDVLWPSSLTGTNWNDNALVIVLNSGGEKVLLMSDISERVERQLIAEAVPLGSEILQVGHHGAANASSSPFLKVVTPNWAVISVNRGNVLGYPASETLERLRSFGAQVVLTGMAGNCTWSSGKDLQCSPFRGYDD